MGDKGWCDGRLVVEWRWEISGGVMEDLGWSGDGR